MKHLSIDIETFSSIDLKKSGLYKYVESPDFQILLFAYSFDGAPVQIIDLAQGERLTPELISALRDPAVIKHAYNAPFEWCGINKFTPSPLSQWRCTMLHGLYCGYTAGLAATAVALGLPEDKRKMGIGAALIRTFCVPCKPSKANGQRERTLPHHEPQKWELFKEYCKQDVAVEMEIERRLSAFPVPDQEQRLWELDQQINAFGVMVDRDLVAGALHCDEVVTGELMAESASLSGLDNPKSVQQLSRWLAEKTGEEITDLRKDTVRELIETIDDDKARRMLEIRQELSKTSVKKYAAMDAAACKDSRIRGLLQFYGANRTGRWCLTGDHEVLTQDGWVRLDEWTDGYIACWSPQTEFISFQKSKSLSFDYTGDLYSIESQRCSQLSTPDHKMPYWGKCGGWKADTVQNLAEKRFSIPFTGRRIVNSNLDHVELRVLIMVQADGHYTHEGDLRFHFSKQRKIERCKNLLRKCGLVFTWFLREKATVITIKSRNLPVWLRMFREKTFEMWLLDESADVIFDELERWDGYRCGPNSIQYTTINKQNADIIQALAHLSGRAATIVTKKRDKDNWSDAYIVNIWLTPGGHNEIRKKPTAVQFSGKVYCAETETGFFIVRRNGKVWVTGNSGRLVQVQNLPRNYMDTLAIARGLVKSKKVDALKVIYGNVPDTLSQLIRTAFIPSPGNTFLVADFSAIEARVIAWLSGEQWRLDVFATHGKIYEASASAMFGVPIELIKKGNPEYELRQKGKVAELALGYQGSAGALRVMGALNMGLTEAELPEIVKRWRSANKRIVDMWYKMENAALDVMTNFRPVGVNGLLLARECDSSTQQDFFTITLPSGRKLFYAKPFIFQNAFGKDALHYKGVNQNTKKWEVTSTYGGKLVENCLAGDVKVLTNHGWVEIKSVKNNDLLWDGVKWVNHEGLVNKGTQQTIKLDGIGVTPDHLILTERGWRCASSCEGYYRDEVTLPDSCLVHRFRWKKDSVGFPLRLWKSSNHASHRIFKRSSEIMWLSGKRIDWKREQDSWYVAPSGILGVALDERPLYFAHASSLAQLWRQGYNCLQKLAEQFRGFLGRHGADIQTRFNAGQEKCERELHPGKLPLGINENTGQKQKGQSNYQHSLGFNNSSGSLRTLWNRCYNFVLQTQCRMARKPFVCKTGRYEQVYDFLNAGPRHRFTVMGNNGPFIVHNCVQAIARDCLAESMLRVSQAGYQIVMSIHDEVVIDAPRETADLEYVCKLMGEPISWAPGLMLRADGYETNYYKKD